MKLNKYRLVLTNVMKNILKLLSLSLFLTLFSLTGLAEEGKSSSFIVITDSTINQQITLTDDKKINRFYYYWSQKQPLQSQKNQAYQWRYQLLIQDNNKSSRWVYDPRGYAREVTLNQSSRIYQFSSVRTFNRFLKSLSNKGN